jgi:hypothetical protein
MSFSERDAGPKIQKIYSDLPGDTETVEVTVDPGFTVEACPGKPSCPRQRETAR